MDPTITYHAAYAVLAQRFPDRGQEVADFLASVFAGKAHLSLSELLAATFAAYGIGRPTEAAW